MTPTMRLKAWKEEFDARLKAEPKANKKAVLREITDDAFGVMPTEEIIAEWMESRAAGDLLQVNGNGSFSGTVNADTYVGKGLRRDGRCGISIVTNEIVPVNGNGSEVDATVDLGRVSGGNGRFKDAHFSGNVNCNNLYVDSGRLLRPTGDCGLVFSSTGLYPSKADGNLGKDAVMDFGGSSDRWKDGHFSGTVNAGMYSKGEMYGFGFSFRDKYVYGVVNGAVQTPK